jgi:2-succinyl-6-hydroxy-2,4-cyclohexadiene-1-carboxylate synthase
MYRWHYTLTGDHNLPPLVLLHGWMGNCDDYLEVIELLKSRFYCIAIDLPGHGKTEVVDDDRGYEFVNTARGIVRFLECLEIDRCTIAGYSFGGRLALYLALEFPDKFDQVILESTSPGLSTVAARAARIISDEGIIHELRSTKFTDFVINWYRKPIFTGIEEHPNFSTLIQRRMANQANNLVKSLKYAGLGKQPYLGHKLKAYHQEVLLIVGAEDEKFVQIAQTLDRDCLCLSLAIVANCSHNVHFQAPAFWTDLLLIQVGSYQLSVGKEK